MSPGNNVGAILLSHKNFVLGVTIDWQDAQRTTAPSAGRHQETQKLAKH